MPENRHGVDLECTGCTDWLRRSRFVAQTVLEIGRLHPLAPSSGLTYCSEYLCVFVKQKDGMEIKLSHKVLNFDRSCLCCLFIVVIESKFGTFWDLTQFSVVFVQPTNAQIAFLLQMGHWSNAHRVKMP